MYNINFNRIKIYIPKNLLRKRKTKLFVIEDEKVNMVEDTKVQKKKFPIPSNTNVLQSFGFGIQSGFGENKQTGSGTLNVFFTDGFKDFSLSAAKYFLILGEVQKMPGTKKQAINIVITELFKLSGRENTYLTKYVKLGSSGKKQTDDEEGGGKILFVQRSFSLDEKNTNNFVEKDIFGIKTSFEKFKEVTEYIHQRKNRIKVEESSEEELDF